MKTSLHRFDFGVLEHFPNAREFQAWEGGCAYLAERDGSPYVIIDKGTLADFIDKHDADLLDELVHVIEFDGEGERETYVHQRLAKAAGVCFLPWVGGDYSTAAQRLLILGEAHYSKDAPTHDFTQKLTSGYVNGKMTHPFWTQVARTVSGQPISRAHCNAFWQTVAFYNFIQEFAGPTSRVRPTQRMWESARKPFLHVLSDLDPHVCLVLGKSLWDNLPRAEAGSLRRADGSAWPTKTYRGKSGSGVLATFIKHPASWGFSRSKWSDVVSALRVAAAKIP